MKKLAAAAAARRNVGRFLRKTCKQSAFSKANTEALMHKIKAEFYSVEQQSIYVTFNSQINM